MSDGDKTGRAKAEAPAMVGEHRGLIWLTGLAVLAALLYALSDVLAPFVAGIAVAYFFDPLADRLEKAGASRGIAAGLVIVAFLALGAALMVVLYPLLQGQIMGFVTKLPDLIAHLREQAGPLIDLIHENIPAGDTASLKDTAGAYAGQALTWIGGILQRIWGGGVAFFSLLSLIVISPIVAFYLLRDWDIIVTRFDELLPRHQADTIREQARRIDTTIAAFVRGQASVCLTLGIYYAVALTVLGLDFGLVVGLGTGIISFIPYVGAGIGMMTGLAIAFTQYSDWLPIAITAAIFVTGQTAESYFLTPRLVGGNVGLHPVWIIFALLAGGALFGFTGVLLAVPTTAVIGVLVRFATERYLQSTLYHGGGGAGERTDS